MNIDSNIINCISKAKNFYGVTRVGIFGSYARGEETDESDIDILYDYYYNDDNDNGIRDLTKFLDILEDELRSIIANKKIDFVSYHSIVDVSEPDEYDIAFRNNVLNDVIWVYEK